VAFGGSIDSLRTGEFKAFVISARSERGDIGVGVKIGPLIGSPNLCGFRFSEEVLRGCVC
jgi:hypothetical protein